MGLRGGAGAALRSPAAWAKLPRGLRGVRGARRKPEENEENRKQLVLTTVFDVFFPTCQVRVVRFYVSLLFSSSFFSFSLLPSPPPRPLLLCRPPQLTGILCVQCGVLDPNGNWDPLSSVWRAGLQLQLASSQFSVACWTPTAIL